MRAGRLDRRVTFLTRTIGQDDNGRPVVTWDPHVTVWAEVRDLSLTRGERIAEAINVANRPCRIRIRYRTDITIDMRVTVDGRELRLVTMPGEIGRREGLEFVAEELTTEGEAP